MSSNSELKSCRLQKYLAAAGLASRRAAEKLIVAGRVQVNGMVVTQLGTQVDPEQDEIRVDGQIVQREDKHLFLFHKPAGLITTLSDPQGRPTVGDALKKLPVRVFPVGRLDEDVSGLLIVTNDGDFAEQLLHPRYGAERTYWARVSGLVGEADLQRLRTGVELPDGPAKVVSARRLRQSEQSTEWLGRLGKNENLIELIVNEGRKHFVKNICEAIGHPVRQLTRVAFDRFELKGLKRGELREIHGYRTTRARKLTGRGRSTKKRPAG